jgi:hypothetical protein
MFDKLSDFSYRRTSTEAVGFYLAYLVLTIILSIAASLLLAPAFRVDGFVSGYRIGNFMAIVVSLVLAFTILHRKQLLDNMGLILVAVLAGVLAYFGGGLLGLIPVAYLTTRPPWR